MLLGLGGLKAVADIGTFFLVVAFGHDEVCVFRILGVDGEHVLWTGGHDDNDIALGAHTYVVTLLAAR